MIKPIRSIILCTLNGEVRKQGTRPTSRFQLFQTSVNILCYPIYCDEMGSFTYHFDPQVYLQHRNSLGQNLKYDTCFSGKKRNLILLRSLNIAIFEISSLPYSKTKVCQDMFGLISEIYDNFSTVYCTVTIQIMSERH